MEAGDALQGRDQAVGCGQVALDDLDAGRERGRRRIPGEGADRVAAGEQLGDDLTATLTCFTVACLGHQVEKAFAGFGGTGVNSPFEGTYVPLKYYGNDPRVSALMIEIRRDVYMSEPGGPAGPGLDALASALAQLVEEEEEEEEEDEDRAAPAAGSLVLPTHGD